MRHLPIIAIIAAISLASCKKETSEEKKCALFEQEKMYIVRDQKAWVDQNNLFVSDGAIYSGISIKRTLTKTGTEAELSAFMAEMHLSYFNNLGKTIVYGGDSVGHLMYFDKLGGEVKRLPCK